MKFALINPPWYSPIAMKFQTSNLGLSYLYSFIESKGQHKVVPIDALFETPEMPVELVPVQFKYQLVYRVGISYENIAKQIPPDTDYVGIAAPTSNNAKIIQELNAVIKKMHPNVKTLIGGPYASASPEDLPKLGVDYSIYGEPEVPIGELLEGKNPKEIKGFVYVENGEMKTLGKADLMENIDDIPYPNREVFHCNELLNKLGVKRLRDGVDIVETKARGVPMIWSRGCPYDCKFCSIHSMNSYKWKYRSPENVIGELIELKEKYNVDEIAVLDDHLIGNRSRFIKILDAMINQKIGLEWGNPNGVRVDYLDREILEKMKASGCNSCVIGIQNGSPRVLEKMDTKLDLRKVEKVVKDCIEVGLNTAAFLIVGYPGERRKDFMESIKFCMNLSRKYGLKDWRINIARAYPKTRLYFDAIQNGWFVNKDVENMIYFPGDDTEANLCGEGVTPKEAIWRRDYAKRKLMSVENPIYWNAVYYMERLKIKQTAQKYIPDKIWYGIKKRFYDAVKPSVTA